MLSEFKSIGGAVLDEVVDMVQNSLHNCPGRGGLPDSKSSTRAVLVDVISLIPNQLVELS